ncbi:hypothetical protein BIW11_03063 [Tropilaelaps mercedesae]|uniref:Uncharacterized protein n=1 Tax=Tropilaelaps mercedesae TaxID=418985 RepID=A0A1V9XSK6_9ACAR|nr:hypothetical protein BIW11_03063 [Tropilaelaps mercedesae]
MKMKFTDFFRVEDAGCLADDKTCC